MTKARRKTNTAARLLNEHYQEHNLNHIRGKPFYPMIQGKIERTIAHRSM
jgi:hypothetical protein